MQASTRDGVSMRRSNKSIDAGQRYLLPGRGSHFREQVRRTVGFGEQLVGCIATNESIGLGIELELARRSESDFSQMH